jgi:hypothetical protein
MADLFVCKPCGATLPHEVDMNDETGRTEEVVRDTIYCVEGGHYAHKACAMQYDDCCDSCAKVPA